jgi:predicted transcriptional regulator
MRSELSGTQARKFARNAQILELSKAGMSRRGVAKLFGITAGRVSQVVHYFGRDNFAADYRAYVSRHEERIASVKARIDSLSGGDRHIAESILLGQSLGDR